uniref:Serine-threonine kinase receptor-associated protein n=1 Tax=Timema bartmani TaxID=61472 RepID=A0A7R9F2L2_9NEOP|nr:unnamed protein product [Timema bartmani]
MKNKDITQAEQGYNTAYVNIKQDDEASHHEDTSNKQNRFLTDVLMVEVMESMKPLMLHGHERAITQIKYNREGDLLFSSGKDQCPNVWYSLNGERLGTFDGHQGAVWSIDVNWETTRFMSGAADQYLRIWDCATGKEIGNIKANSSVRTCNFSYSGNMAVYSTDKQLGHQCEMMIIDVRNVDESLGGLSTRSIFLSCSLSQSLQSLSSSSEPILRIPFNESKVTSLLWGALDEIIITGHENGDISQWDLRNGKKLMAISDHAGSINDMQMNKDGTMFITASKDKTAKLFDSDSLMFLKCYKTERPVNSAAVSPIFDHFHIMYTGNIYKNKDQTVLFLVHPKAHGPHKIMARMHHGSIYNLLIAMPLKQILLYILGRRVNQALDHSAAKANITKPDALFAHQVVLGGGQEAMDILYYLNIKSPTNPETKHA